MNSSTSFMHIHKPSRPPRQMHCGFALIATISVMVLLVMIALAMLGLSSIELRSSKHADAMATAQANARMALMIAIGELQQTTGTDQSITAPAAILHHEGFSQIDVHPSKQHYLIAFSSREPSDQWAESRSDAFERYLVSGTNKDVTQVEFGARPLPSDSSTVRMSNANTPAEHEVKVPLVAIDESGRYGYWINGHGARASVALNHRSNTHSEHLAPDRFNIRSAGMGNLDWLPGRDQAELHAKTVTIKTLEIQSGTGGELDRHLHWISRNNRALLTNPKDGGFKKDLTAAFNASTKEMEAELGARMFPPAQDGKEGDESDPGGPKWQQAGSYYNLNQTGDIPVRPQTENQMGIYPVIAGFTEFYGASDTNGYAPAAISPPFPSPGHFNKQGSSRQNALTMHMSPVVKLWNPYNRTLASSSYTIAVKNNDSQYDSMRDAGKPGKSDESMLIWSNLTNAAARLPLGIRFEHRYLIPAVSFAPGEVKVFSLRRNTFLDSYKKGAYSPGPESIPKTVAQGEARIVDIIGEGYILAELEEGPFTGHTLWDLHCTVEKVSEYDAENDPNTFYITGRGTPGNPYPAAYRQGDGSKTVILDSRSTNKDFKIIPGNLNTWSIELYQGRVEKSQTASSVRPLVAIKNINTSIHPDRQLKFKQDVALNDANNLHTNTPYFKDNAHIDGIWARTVSLRLSDNLWDSDPNVLNASQHGTKKVKWLGHFNPRSPTVGCWPEEYAKQSDPIYPGQQLKLDGASTGTRGYGLGTPGNYLSGILLDLADVDDAMPQPYIGYSDISDTDRCVLFDIPTNQQPESWFFSIGQLRHANLSIENGDYLKQLSNGHGAEDFFSDNMGPAYPIGESLADIRLKTENTQGKYRTMSIEDGDGVYQSTHYDTSWHMNQLWDSAFFSARQQQDDGKSSHNPRIRVINPGSLPLDPSRDGIKYNASRVFLDGGFNVNSTHVEAWHAFLAATLGAAVNGQSDDGRAPFSRFHQPQNVMATETSYATDPEIYDGFRGLSEAEIASLAQQIVEQVKRRGPFLSLADFVNRSTRTGAPGELTHMGPLQAAINASGINRQLDQTAGFSIDADDVSSVYNQDAYQGDIAHGVPGYLTQGDILARMGQLLTTRSDTFTIRAYGEAFDRNGKVTARAWCEAEIQRFPEYLQHQTPDTTANGGDEPHLPYDELVSKTNQRYGRRYQITAFRWIPSEEIQ